MPWISHPAARLTVLAVALALTVGWAGGTIAIHIAVLHLHPFWGAVLGLLQCGPLLFAVFRPLVAWRISALGMFLGVLTVTSQTDGEFWPWPVTSFLAQIVLVFLVATAYQRRISGGAGVVVVFGLFGSAIVIGGMPSWFGLILTGIVLFALVLGDAVGGRYAAEASLAEQAELRRQELAAHAVLEERARIARELHDVVAHHMSVIVMQAQAAPYKIPDLPEPAKETFSVVHDAARQALAETRRVVGLLRAEDEAAERLPQPGLDRLDELTAAARRSGLDVAVSIVGMPRPVTAGVDLSAYRIVQESLSNAARYAPGSRAGVEVRYGNDLLRVTVTDDGPHGEPAEPGGGHGLVGMRERVTMLGGTLAAGPRPDVPGWTVLAELPYGED
ncbi:sensor histidine kinase [Actinomadura craniellae]|uniref:histidine kinase n=2 Tax=Actinomadura craniellae TaxID=2231787 RepID=A0A365HH22_9ACTN|nr:sensor histidine kinase [Actinomadura craniellae]